MSRKTYIYIAAAVGGLIGGYIPAMWGAGPFSGWGMLVSGLGSIVGAIVVIRLT